MQLTVDHNMKASVLGGTLFTAILNLSWDDILFTVIMAAIGAFVSFLVSLILRWILRKVNL